MRLCNVIFTFLFLISLYIALSEAKVRYCGKVLIGRDNIANFNIKASSNADMSVPHKARMNGDGDGWTPDKQDKHPYLEFSLGNLYLVCGFEVKGCKRSWPTRYRVQVSPEKDFWDSWNYIKPEFYGGTSAEHKVYSIAKERKVGRNVRIFPYDAKLNHVGHLCMKVEIYGNPYLRVGQEVFARENSKTMSYHKTTIKSINIGYMRAELSDRNRRLNYWPDYTQIIPRHKPLKTEIRVNTCVLIPGSGHSYVAGRVDEIKGNGMYAVIEKLTDANRGYKGQEIRRNTFTREQLQVVFSAWCEKIVFFARVPNLNSRVSYGQIVSVDSKLVFLQNAQGGLYRLSYTTEKDSLAFFVSKKKIKTDEVEFKKTKLWFADAHGYLKTIPAPDKDTLSKWINRKHAIVWYKESKDKPDVCKTSEPGICHASRIPFTVVRQNCSNSQAWNGKTCADEDECKTGMAACALLASCKNTEGFYECECSKGVSGENPRTEDCKDIDECKDENKCNKDATCKNTIGSFTCHCKKGFKEDGHRCVDVDECKILANKKRCEKHKNAFCRNFPGSFGCECKPGYHGNLEQCKDLDECTSKKHKCSPYAHCTNTMGSYKCKCNKGFHGDGRDCKDKQECKEPSKSSSCHAHGHCVDTLGGYKCMCNEGYDGDGVNSCEIANECERGIHKCHKTWATCVDTLKSYDCHCNKGFTGDGRTCQDIDECARKKHYCGATFGIECINTNGSYGCACAKGFIGDGKNCVDIDECKTGTHNCGKHAICANQDGKFTCTCREGFWGDPTKKCEATTSCLKKLPHCDVPRAVCRNVTDKKFECFCKPGYTGDNSNCIDIDECLNKQDSCSKDANCTNTAGGFLCRCKEGFVGNGFNCSDVNECSNKNRCPHHANCINTVGSFQCKCNVGFTGETCSDFDECTVHRICEYGQKCTNTFGSYDCSCDQGYYLIDAERNKCEDIDECKNVTKLCGTYQLNRCENTIGNYSCRCNPGFEFNRKVKRCRDIDECKSGDWPCAEEANCNNNEGGYSCACPKGYLGDGKYFCEVENSSPSHEATTGWTLLVAMATLLLI